MGNSREDTRAASAALQFCLSMTGGRKQWLHFVSTAGLPIGVLKGLHPFHDSALRDDVPIGSL